MRSLLLNYSSKAEDLKYLKFCFISGGRKDPEINREISVASAVMWMLTELSQKAKLLGEIHVYTLINHLMFSNSPQLAKVLSFSVLF